jgi:hypothetical protein
LFEKPTATEGLYTYDYTCRYLVQGGSTVSSPIIIQGYVGAPPTSSEQIDEGGLCFYFGCYSNTGLSDDGEQSLDMGVSLFEGGGVTVSATFYADLSNQSEAESYDFVWSPIDDNDESDTHLCYSDTYSCVVTDISSEGIMDAYVQTTNHGELYDWARLTRSYPSCGNAVKDTIMAEYRAFSVTIKPECEDFANSGGTANFSWAELNGGFAGGSGHSPWGIVRASMKTGVESTRTNYNRGGIRISSGYRCPHGNRRSDGVAQSRHMRGDAADMYSVDHAWTETEFNLLKAAADLTGPVESFTWATYPNDRHYHAAWQ